MLHSLSIQAQVPMHIPGDMGLPMGMPQSWRRIFPSGILTKALSRANSKMSTNSVKLNQVPPEFFRGTSHVHFRVRGRGTKTPLWPSSFKRVAMSRIAARIAFLGIWGKHPSMSKTLISGIPSFPFSSITVCCRKAGISATCGMKKCSFGIIVAKKYQALPAFPNNVLIGWRVSGEIGLAFHHFSFRVAGLQTFLALKRM